MSKWRSSPSPSSTSKKVQQLNNCYTWCNYKFYGTDKRYAYLTSLDLICDQPESYDLWIKEVGHDDAVSILHTIVYYKIINYFEIIIITAIQLKSMVKDQRSSRTYPKLSNQDSDTTDTTLLYPYREYRYLTEYYHCMEIVMILNNSCIVG